MRSLAGTLQGGRGQWAGYYTATQSFITMLALKKKLLVSFDWCVQIFQPINLIYGRDTLFILIGDVYKFILP